jgi:hypothetical protein
LIVDPLGGYFQFLQPVECVSLRSSPYEMMGPDIHLDLFITEVIKK